MRGLWVESYPVPRSLHNTKLFEIIVKGAVISLVRYSVVFHKKKGLVVKHPAKK